MKTKKQILSFLTNNMEKKIPSSNIGVYENNGQIGLCIIKFNQNSNGFRALSVTGEPVDENIVTPLSNCFIVKHTPDSEEYGELIAHIEKSNVSIFDSIKSQKSIDTLVKLSIYERDIHWYNEDHGVWIVNENLNKTISLGKLAHAQKHINKLEKRAQKQQSFSVEK